MSGKIITRDLRLVESRLYKQGLSGPGQGTCSRAVTLQEPQVEDKTTAGTGDNAAALNSWSPSKPVGSPGSPR